MAFCMNCQEVLLDIHTVMTLKKQLEDAQEQYQKLVEEKKEADKKKLFAAYQKSKRSLDEVIDFLKGKADI